MEVRRSAGVGRVGRGGLRGLEALGLLLCAVMRTRVRDLAAGLAGGGFTSSGDAGGSLSGT